MLPFKGVVFSTVYTLPGYLTWVFWVHSGRYRDTKPGYFGHTRVNTGVPNLGVWSYSGRYRGTKPGYFGHTRVDTGLPNLDISIILGEIPRYQT